MRKFAFLREPLQDGECGEVVKIMLCEAEEGWYLFEYSSLDAVLCSADRCYASLAELLEDWDPLIDERGWIPLEDALPDCQQDAFLPLRVKGRESGRPEWGKWETLRDGKWVAFRPEERT